VDRGEPVPPTGPRPKRGARRGEDEWEIGFNVPVNPSPGAPTLILVPTPRELAGLGGFACLVELCGFGPVAAAARTAHLLARLAPRRVLLVGLAGSYDPQVHPLGSALVFGRVSLDGLGAGEGPTRLGPEAMGLVQFEGVGERLALAGQGPDLLTVCAASAGEAQAAERAERFGAAAEDMEAFGVALACTLTNTPLTVVRGVSNRCGERDQAHWDIPGALAAARLALLAELDR
jgi:futalosine hydrolase